MSKHLVSWKIDSVDGCMFEFAVSSCGHPIQYKISEFDLESALREHIHYKNARDTIAKMSMKIAELENKLKTYQDVRNVLDDTVKQVCASNVKLKAENDTLSETAIKLVEERDNISKQSDTLKTECHRLIDENEGMRCAIHSLNKENERLKAQTTSTESKCKQCTKEELCKSLVGENLLGRRNCTAFIPKLTRTRRIDGETRTYDVTTQDGINAYTMDMIKMLNERVNECERKQKEPVKKWCGNCKHGGKSYRETPCSNCIVEGDNHKYWEKA